MDRLLNQKELAEYLGVPETWVRDKVTAREIPHTRIGRHVRFTPEHVAAIVSAGEQPALVGPLAAPRLRPMPISKERAA